MIRMFNPSPGDVDVVWLSTIHVVGNYENSDDPGAPWHNCWCIEQLWLQFRIVFRCLLGWREQLLSLLYGKYNVFLKLEAVQVSSAIHSGNAKVHLLSWIYISCAYKSWVNVKQQR